MLLKTKYFGELEVQESEIIIFEDGIPGFANLHKFLLIIQDDSGLGYLQSVEEDKICFVVIPPALIIPEYNIEISKSTVKKLNIKKPEEVCLFSILTIPENIKDMTANLKAPIVINITNRKGIQEILDDDKLSIRYKIAKEADASC